LTLDEFEAELHAPGRKRVAVRLHVQTSAIKADAPYVAKGSLSPIYPATPGKELLGKPVYTASTKHIKRDSPDGSRRDVNFGAASAFWQDRLAARTTPSRLPPRTTVEGVIWPFSLAFERTPPVGGL
jgi:hypothetical protein